MTVFRPFPALIAAAALLLTGAGAAAALTSERLLIVNKSGDTLAITDAHSYEILALAPTRHEPHEVAASPDRRTAYVSDYGSRDRRGNTVTVVDIASGEVTATWNLGENLAPHGVAVSRDGTRVWVTTEASQTVVELDAAGGDILTVWETGQDISHMVTPSVDETRLFVTNLGSGSLTVIDRRDDSVTTIPTGAGAEGVDVTPDGREVWVTNRAEHTISVLDTQTLEELAKFDAGGQVPIRVKFTPDGARAFVSNALSNSLTVFDAASRELIHTVDVGALPVGILMSPDGGRVFVANTRDDKVSVFDAHTYELIDEIFPGSEPDGMAWAVIED
ncbi:MAG: beta-propeller fold lactonase family protein [Oceanicaulis sp.]|nr:beta-propeller fold lactonase family protein [Oceanicaulis sp.]